MRQRVFVTRAVESLSLRERGRGEGPVLLKPFINAEPSSGAARHLFPMGEGKSGVRA